MKQSALAMRSGTSQSEISEIESGTREPGVHLAIRIARALSVTVYELFDERSDIG